MILKSPKVIGRVPSQLRDRCDEACGYHGGGGSRGARAAETSKEAGKYVATIRYITIIVHVRDDVDFASNVS